VSVTRRGRRALAAFGVAAVCGSVATAAAAWPGARGLSRAEPGAIEAPASPALSIRRIPALVEEPARRIALTERLRAVLAGADACVVVRSAGETVADESGGRALPPASTVKLLTGLAAIEALGPRARLATRVLGPRPAAGVVHGDLFLVGGGDPTLGTDAYARTLAARPRYAHFPVTRLETLADRVAASGVRRVAGRVLGDDSALDTTRFLSSWSETYRSEVGPIGALVANGGFDPVGSASRVDDPAGQAAAVLTALLAARGIAVDGGAARGRAPSGTPEIARVESPPVRDLVAAMLEASDNLTAEVLTRLVGRAAGGAATTEAGVAAIEDRVRRLGIPTAGIALSDGSGLARSDRATCAALVAALDRAREPRFRAVADGLPVAAERGTLITRFAGTPLAHRLHAKTGNISGVVGLAGWLEGQRPLRFAFLASGGFGTLAGQDLQARVGEAIASFTAPTPLERLPPP
jgi:D-alanyl-D-alanine carboxypeptidase/D-alanyl-D-alanine-endopeptidase (penicillin-binding protein 4)